MKDDVLLTTTQAATQANVVHDRLDVLRGVFAAVLNDSKAGIPINTDRRISALLAKQIKASRHAAAQFEAAERFQLKAKEDAQLAILEEYKSSIPTISDEEVAQAVTKILASSKVNGNILNYGNVMRDLTGRDGAYFGKALDMDRVHEIVKEKTMAEEKK